MVSKRELVILLTDVEKEYEKCWDILAGIKGNTSNFDLNEFFDFQFILSHCLFSLDSYYRRITQEEKEVIRKKGQVDFKWFKKRLKDLAFYKKLIKKSIKMGKELGDYFAWIFYSNAPDYLEKNFKHELMMHTPPGIGGLGELEFIKNLKIIEGNFVLYHGITTFLRVGDISLIDLRTFEISAIGELKTKKLESGKLEITVQLIGPKNSNLKKIKVKKSENSENNLSPEIKQKLKKQMKEMNSVFEKKEKMDSKDVLDGYHIDELKELITSIKTVNFTHKSVGDGLVIFGIKTNLRKITSRLMDETPKIINERNEDIQRIAKTIVDGKLNDNSLIIGQLDPMFLIGSTPIFWWPVDIEFLRELFFGEIIVVTIYNPAHFINKLRILGFTVKNIKKYEYSVEKVINKNMVKVNGISYFVSFIQNHLLREDVIVEVLSEFIKKIESGEIPASTKVQLGFIHHLHQ